jgi:hypothetical protein
MFVFRRCSRCIQDLPEDAFNRAGDGRQYWCRECFRRYFRERGSIHLEQVRSSQHARREPLRRRVIEHFRNHPCADCGEADLVVLEFDHVRGKTANVSHLVHTGVPLSRLDAEIALCEVVCANCHRRRTAARAGWDRTTFGTNACGRRATRLRNVAWVYGQLRGACCQDCGLSDVIVLEFDHVGQKTDSVMKLAWRECSLQALAAEIEQCEVRCCNCHRRRTASVQAWFRLGASYPRHRPP